MATIYDVAKKANVSVKTVSRVLNRSQLVKQETRSRVLAAMAALDFHPNSAARSLRRKRTGAIGFVVPFGSDFVFHDPGMIEQIKGALDLLNERGYDMVLSVPTNRDDALREVVRLTKRRNVDGAILYGMTGADSIVKELSEKGFHFVSLGYCYPEQTHNFVEIDAVAGGIAATRYAISLGHTRIGLIREPSNFLLPNKRSIAEGYKAALEQAGIPYDERLVREGDYTVSGGYWAALRLLDQDENTRVSAIICSSDPTALGALRALRERGLVPASGTQNGFLLLAGDCLPSTRLIEPSLGGIQAPLYEQGRLAADMLVSVISERRDVPGIVLKPTMLVPA
ncbi:MAG: LacI family DNA-binding transcriptional regulator [Betaproteobacteria bacterium]